MNSNKFTTTYCFGYTILWQLYLLQGPLGLTTFAKFLIVILLVYSLYKVIDVNLRYKVPIFLKGVNLLLLMFTVYGIVYLIAGEDYIINSASGIVKLVKWHYLKNIYSSLPTIYVYYDYAQKGVLRKEKNVFALLIILLISAIVGFFGYYAMVTEETGASFKYIDGLTNNMGYRFVPIMALCFVVKKWRFPIICICMAFIVASLKRGALVVGIVSFITYFYMLYCESTGLRRIAVVAFFVVAVVAGGYFGYDFYEKSEGMQRRLEQTLEGNSSGRDELYTKILEYYPKQESTLAMLIGNGADSTVGLAGNYAHDDWLELLMNQGLLGIVVYMVFYMYWYRTLQVIKRKAPDEVKVAFGLLLLGSLVTSIFSMAYSSFGATSCIVIGMALTYYSNTKRITYGEHTLSN